MATKKKSSKKAQKTGKKAKKAKKPAKRKSARKKMAGKGSGAEKPAKQAARRKSSRDRQKARTGTFEELVAARDPAVQKVARTLRSLVRRVVPGADEMVYLDWRIAVYADAEPICGIQPMKSRCNFYLRRGAELDDPDDLLEGTAEVIRHVKIRSLDEMPARSLIRLVRAGKELQTG